DEGPDVGGAYGPYRQSEREGLYEAAVAELDVFACSCSRRELREAADAGDGEEAVYPGTCRDGPRHPERRLALRWRTPPGVVEVTDRLAGPLRQDVRAEVGEFLLRRRDQAWAYQLAVVVDDAAMAITDVVRGADLLTSTPRQVLLFRALAAAVPRFAHVPLILGPDGAKLSKRHGAPDLSALREGGARPERVVALLARSVGLVGPEVEAIRAAELVGDFDLESLTEVSVDWRDLAGSG
ncbi:MAG: tRNA glutamyl-Q(34) synthetase GluQRS, partial [Myxococcales bacterium]|nr:tRNA glutamyl-Q(34) synthetase GluQRS [Myxococcales bacterium]